MVPEQVEYARREVLRNAVGLLRDARLLLRNRRYPRAYALAHLATEEMSKLPMLVRAGLESQTDKSYDWRTIGKRMQSHRSKLRSAALWEYLRDPEMIDDADLKRLVNQLTEVGSANDLKNQSLYAGFVNGEFRCPRESVSAEVAKAMVERAMEHLSAYLAAEGATRGAVATASPESIRRVRELAELMKPLRNEPLDKRLQPAERPSRKSRRV